MEQLKRIWSGAALLMAASLLLLGTILVLFPTPATKLPSFTAPGPTPTANICLWGCPIHYDGPPANFTIVAPTEVPEEWPSKCYFEIDGTITFAEGPHYGYSAPVSDTDWGLDSSGQHKVPKNPLVGLCQLFQTTVGDPTSVLKFDGSEYNAVVEIPG